MTVDERRKYLHKIRLRYRAAQTKKERSRLLDEAQAVINLHRKSLIRLLNGELARKRRTGQRGKTYGAEVEAAIHLIARSLDYPCAERLKPNLVWMAKHLQAHGELQVSEQTLVLLERIGVSSLRRRLPASQQAARRIAHRQGKAAPTSGLKAFNRNTGLILGYMMPLRALDDSDVLSVLVSSTTRDIMFSRKVNGGW